MASSNSHIRNYLDYYVNFPRAPGFAVLLSGPWGVGKTYLVRKILDQEIKFEKYAYVSLYGLTNLDQIEEAVFRALFPGAGWAIARGLGGGAVAKVKQYTGIDSAGFGDALADKFSKALYVFDDLERCRAPVDAVLGYINEFVEHKKRKLIIIANETEILKGPDADKYKNTKEKLVGKILGVRAEFEEALRFFISLVDNSDAREIFTQSRDVIKEIYDQSDTHNLRLLQQSLWDFERVFSALTEKQQKTTEGVRELLALFLALSIEVKAARISEDDLRNRISRMFTGQDSQKTPAQKAASRYPSLILGDNILPDNLLADILVSGFIDQSEIRLELDKDWRFQNSGEEAPWRTVWWGAMRADRDFEVALEKMKAQFALREFTISGEMLHLFGINLWLATESIEAGTREEVVSAAKSYIDELQMVGKLEPLMPFERDGMHFGGYGGLAIMEWDTPEMVALRNYLADRRVEAGRATFNSKAAELLDCLSMDPPEFFRRIGFDVSLLQIPVLASIPPEKFVEGLLALEPQSQYTVMRGLKQRYGSAFLCGELSDEKPWLVAIREKLLAAQSGKSPLGKYRIRHLVELYLSPYTGKT